MGIKSLTQTIKKFSPDSITNENLYKLSGKKVAVDASLIIYQQLLNNRNGFFKNSNGKITNHITGLFYKIMNYISLNIELIFIFDGSPPTNKKDCIQQRKIKSQKAKEMSEKTNSNEEKIKLEKQACRLTKEMIDDVKQLLNLMGISYIHPSEAEGEAYAAELCRIGYVDYVLTEDMDTLVYCCPKLIRKCIDRSIKRNDIISIFDYESIIQNLNLTSNQFIDFCILCGCDYAPEVPKIGNITALKLIQKYQSMEEIINNTNYNFPENYKELYIDAKKNFLLFKDKINVDEIKLITSDKNINELKNYLVNEIEMNETKVNNAIKKFNNKYSSED